MSKPTANVTSAVDVSLMGRSAPDGPTVDAVLLDVGGVLLLPDPTRVGRALEGAGLEVPGDEETFRSAHYVGAMAYDRSDDRPETWPAYLQGYADGLGFRGDLRERALDALVDMWQGPGHEHWSWRQDDAVSALARLADRGLRLGVVSNADGTVERALSDHHVCQVGPGSNTEVEFVIDSAVVGIQKPDPAIFALALDALGLEPDRVLYVGDTVRNDVRGAEAAGIPVVHLDPYGLYPEATHTRVSGLHDVATALGA